MNLISNVDLTPLLLILTVLLLIALTVIVVSSRRSVRELRDALISQSVRMEEQSRQGEHRGQRVEDAVRNIETQARTHDQQLQKTLEQRLTEIREHLQQRLGEHQARFEQRHGEAVQSTQEILDKRLSAISKQLTEALERKSDDLEKRVNALTTTVDEQLKAISGQVDKRLDEGFEKTNRTFVDIQKRLVVIDQAQKEITKLSSNVVSLQEVLSDKRSRGAFGEMQLNALVRNVMPENSFSIQHTLSNNKVADCMLFLPPPTGHIAIDAKFPKESYDRMTDVSLSPTDRRDAERQFKLDIKKHVQDIAEKYVIAGETADGAVMFIPAEAIFAEIHAHHTDLVEDAYRQRVWLVSPTTLMAILNTARAVLKDEETRKQVHIIQDHLRMLSTDFGRFQTRMDQLSKHIGQANDDVQKIHTSAKKITSRFGKIERVELSADDTPTLLEQDADITD